MFALYKFKIILLAVFSFVIPVSASAGYIATGPITSSSCSNFIVFSSCEKVTVDAMSSNGAMYEPRRTWDRVDEYNPKSGSCVVRVGRGGSIAITDKIINAVTLPTFYTRKNGALEKINIEYLRFPCRPTY